MRFSKQLNASSISVPNSFEEKSTSELLDRGLIVHRLGGGLVSYSAIGQQVLEKIEQGLCSALAHDEYSEVRFPQIMRDSDLEAGEELGGQFARKMIRLQGTLSGSHLLTSPEMLLPAIAVGQDVSVQSLPILICYRTSIFRAMTKTKSFLTCREFRVVGAMALVPRGDGEAGVDMALSGVGQILQDFANDLGVQMSDVRKGNEVELAYRCAEGDLRVGDEGREGKHLSVAVGFEYARGISFPVTYRDSHNELVTPRVMTTAICSNRLLYAVFDASRDTHGFDLPASIRPFDLVIVPRSTADEASALVAKKAAERRGVKVAIDDRMQRSVQSRVAISAYIGAAAAAIVHRGNVILVKRGLSVDYTLADSLDDSERHDVFLGTYSDLGR